MHPSPATDPRYPIGRFSPAAAGPSTRHQEIESVSALPATLAAALANLDSTQLDTPYREGGWTLRQLAHHLADSHLNAYARLRLALTEDWPVIKPYREEKWAELKDARTLPIDISLQLLSPLHGRWTALLQSLDDAAWSRGYTHTENGRTSVETMTALYSWHGRHHVAHILALRERMGW